MTDRRLNITLFAIPLGYLGIAIISALVDRPFMWGINHLRYYPSWIWFVCAVPLVLVSIPAVRERLVNLSGLHFSRWWVTAGLTIVGALCFVFLQDTTHLLGDGHLLTRELEHGFRKIANEPLSLWLLDRLLGLLRPSGVSAAEMYTAWSILSGLVFLLLLPSAVRQLDRASTLCLTVFALLPAYTQLFFGYHETYPLLYPLLLIYIGCAAAAMREELPGWVPLAVLAVMVAFHFTMATLLPSALFVLAPSGSLQERATRCAKAFRQCLPGLVVFFLLMWATDFDPAEYQARAAGETFLPVSGPATHSVPYTVFSSSHLIEFLNEQLLVFLPVLLLLTFANRSFFATSTSQFLLAAGIPAWVTTFFGFTVIGAFRDWDALAFPALFLTLWSAMGVVRSYDGFRRRSIVLVVVATAAVHAVLWVSVNAVSHRATARFEHALEFSHLSDRARSFGWETVGVHYADSGDMENASRSYVNASHADPKHPRYPSLLGFTLMQMGDYEGAAHQFRLSISLDEERYATHLNLGMALLKLDEAEAAVNAIRKAWVLAPERSQIPFALGVAYYAQSEYRKSIGSYLAVLRMDPDHVSAHMNLAQLYGLVSDNSRKQQHFERVLSLDPSHPQRGEIEDWLGWYSNQ
jgi:Tfp pilus assembly protein PilF